MQKKHLVFTKNHFRKPVMVILLPLRRLKTKAVRSSAGLSDPGVGGGAMADFLAYQITLSQPGGADYAQHFNTGTPDF